MELRHLRYFVAVAESLHFGRAAERLRIAQPSLSHQIRQLEVDLGTTLLQRTRREVHLTDAGQRFLDEARAILAHADRAALVARTATGGASERLRVGFDYWMDLAALCAAVKRFDESHPTVRVELRGMPVALQIDALRDGHLDMGFVRPPVSDPSLASEPLTTDTFMVALSRTHRLAGRSGIRAPALAKEAFIMAPRETLPFFHGLVLGVCRDAGFVPRVRDEVDYPSMVLALVAAGLGVSLVPASVRKIQLPGVVLRSLTPKPRLFLETAIAWRRDAPVPSLQGFRQVVHDVTAARGRRVRHRSDR